LKIPKLSSVSSLQLFQLIRFAGFFLTGIALVKIGTPITTVGAFEKLMFLAGLSSFFWVQGIITTLLSNYHGHKEKDVYLFNVFLLVSLLSVTVFLLLDVLRQPIENLLADGALPGYYYIKIYILFNAPCYLIETIYILKKRNGSLVNYGWISTAGTLCSVVLPVYFGYSLASGIALLTLWSALRYLWLLRLMLKYVIPEIKLRYVKQHFFISLPLILSFIISGSAEYIDGLLVTHYFDASQFALFRYGARELPLSLLMANALSISVIPIIKEQSVPYSFDIILKESKRLINIVFPVSALLLVVSPWLFSSFFNEHFRESSSIFNIYILLVISRTAFPQSILLVYNKSKAMLYISAAEILVNFICSFFLMKSFGLAGIAWGTIIAHYFEKAVMMIYLYSKFGIRPQQYVPATWLYYSTVLIVVYFFTIASK
jgi:O-antigen/teichoic acid export membrane protein